LHHLRDKARYWSKIVISLASWLLFSNKSSVQFSSVPRAFDAPVRGSRRNIAIPFGMEKLEWWGYPIVKKKTLRIYVIV